MKERDSAVALGDAGVMTGMLHGKVTLISGAGAGIGRAVAHRFAQEGATLWLNELRHDAFDAVLAEVRALGATAEGLPGDMSEDRKSVV